MGDAAVITSPMQYVSRAALGGVATGDDASRTASRWVFASFASLLAVYVMGAVHMQSLGHDQTSTVVVFALLWSLYGAFFVLRAPDVAYNALDVVSKCCMALTTAFVSF